MIENKKVYHENLNICIPSSLIQLINSTEFEEATVGCSKARVFRVRINNSDKFGYLKICETQYESFYREVELLRWLEGKLSAPKVLYYISENGMEYFLMTEVEGSNTIDMLEAGYDKEVLVKNLAQGLRCIHSVDIKECPFDETLEKKLKNARYNIENNLVDIDDIKSTDVTMTPGIIMDRLNTNKPCSEDLVFTHGDYCLPNVILKDGTFSGFIDWGRGGVSDRYQDIGIACRSIKHKFKDELYVELFLKEYGLKEYDKSKIDYYILLDELF